MLHEARRQVIIQGPDIDPILVRTQPPFGRDCRPSRITGQLPDPLPGINSKPHGMQGITGLLALIRLRQNMESAAFPKV